MKKIIILTFTCSFIMAISSCKKCQTCSATINGDLHTQEYCEKNFNSKEEYENWISDYETAGGECN